VDQLLKPSDVVRYLGTSRTWVYDAAKRGDIPSIRLGTPDGPLRFIERDLENWISEARAHWQPGRAAVANPRNTRPRARTQRGGSRSNGDSASQMKFEV
jgi:predicted DNA-binding transcriptional regulator AlpA